MLVGRVRAELLFFVFKRRRADNNELIATWN